MPELSSDRRGLAHGVVQNRRSPAFQRAGGNGLPFVWRAGWVSTGQNRTGPSGRALVKTVCGQGGGVGAPGCKVRGRNVTRVYFNRRTGESVRELLGSATGATSGPK